ncbi:MAG: hypothetical protein ACRYHA_27855 [Janthinobacterium lividum]
MLFMTRKSLVRWLVKIKRDLRRAEGLHGHAYPHVIAELDRSILDVKATRVDDIQMPGPSRVRVIILAA